MWCNQQSLFYTVATDVDQARIQLVLNRAVGSNDRKFINNTEPVECSISKDTTKIISITI